GADRWAIARHVAQRLTASDLNATEIAPSTIVVIRRLDGGQGHLTERSRRSSRASWEAAVRQEIGRLARTASRPAIENVPARAVAVRFNDHAELLACLARDSARGIADGRWWWAELFGSHDLRRLVAREWMNGPVHVAAALDLLAGW